MLDFIRNAGAFVVAIGILVAFHEFGHFWVARKLGVKVLRYSIGFGKPLLTRKGKDGCEYVLAAVPLGGYVKMLDEREGEVPASEAHRAFNRQSPYKRFAIVAAGPIANFLLAIVFFWMVYVIGQPGLKPVVAEPPSQSAAAKAGVRVGEVITRINGEPVETWTSLRTAMLEHVVARKALVLQMQHSTSDPSARTVTVPLDSVRMDPEFLFEDLGLSPYQPKIEPIITSVEPGGAAEQAGFKAGDKLLTRDGIAIEDWQEWALWVRANAGAIPLVTFERDGQVLSLKPLLATIEEDGKRMGRFGARIELPRAASTDLMAEDRLSPFAAVPAAIEQTWRMSALTLKMFGRMFTGDVSVKNVSGPLQIAEAAGFTASIGVTAFLSFLALVSVSLGVLNLLPVPLLDGGHLVYYTVEIIKGSPLSEQVMAAGQRVGLTFLILLMGLAFYNDISRLVG
ncbi:MAG: RIP metalloprotease RseP [Stagnimonas sp.]|nr:RIP metalloprotease RseP [Stagnimonas sp.]